jgi:hypothetical protein
LRLSGQILRLSVDCGSVDDLAFTQKIGHAPVFVSVTWIIVLVGFALKLLPDAVLSDSVKQFDVLFLVIAAL